MPARTLGWSILAWTADWLQHPDGSPWRFTQEQMRFVLHWYAVDEHDRFLYRDGVLQRLKGWGKSPLGATLCAVEFVGPSRPSGRDATEEHQAATGIPVGQPLGVEHPAPWVQCIAVSRDSNRTTMSLFPSLFTKKLIEKAHIDLGKEVIYGRGGTARIESVTSSPRALEGTRPSFCLKDEIQHWVKSNDGHEMDAVIDRNLAKSSDGSARSLATTNAFEPGEDSVGERARDAWAAMESGRSQGTGLLYDSLEAPPDAPLTAAAAPEVIRAVRGDASWLDVDRIVQAILDPRNPPSRSRRFWFNQITAREDAWVTPQEWDACADPLHHVPDGARVTLGFDGSTTDDHSALMACLIEEDHLFTVGVWEPAQDSGEVDRGAIDLAVRQEFDRWDVVGFYSDLHPWESFVDRWAEDFGEKLIVKASPRHSIAWDMRGRQQASTTAFERLHDAIVSTAAEAVTARSEHREPVRQFTHDGNSKVAQHAYNARRRPNRWGISIGKEQKDSPRKIDAIPAAALARLARQDFLALPEIKRRSRQRTGRAAFL